MNQPVYLALGTNLGDRIANLQAARDALPPPVNILRTSPVYETPPWGFERQPAFFNQVLETKTQLGAVDLLAYLKELETRLGRTLTFQYGPRLIDLDILLIGDAVMDLPGLVIPHPRMAERAFVLKPLADLAPDLTHPVSRKTIREMLGALDSSGIVRLNS